MLLYNIVSGKPRLGCMLRNRQKPSGKSLCHLHPRENRFLYPLHESRISLYRFCDEKDAVSHSSAPEHGIVNAQLHNLSGFTKETRPENLQATPSLSYILRRIIVTHAHFC